ncbi:MAG TPA: GxGYxYP family putative glycoside hydrolase [Sedimentisphaerales bacterium]|nr:GxGYxYP family putative glycoside hydrolase [Sedimentisphaerales bacterium]
MSERVLVVNDVNRVLSSRVRPDLVLVALSCLLWVLPAKARPPAIKLFDLGYTLKIDANNRQHVRMAWDHCHTVAVLQGLVNREGPTLYLRFTESQHRKQNVDDFWLEKLSKPGQWLHGRPVERIDTIADLVRQFRSHIRGLVVYDPNVPATSNVASTIAGAESLLPVRYDPAEGSLYRLLTSEITLPVVRRLVNPDGTSLFIGRGTIPGTDHPSTGSAKCDAYLWMKHHYLDAGRCDGAYGAYYLDQYWIQKPRNTVLNHHCLTNHDFFVARNAFFFDLGVWGDEKPIDDPKQEMGTDLETLKALLRSAYEHGGRERMIHIGGFVPWAHKYTTHGDAGGHHDPVPSEWEYGKVISAYNGFMDADAVSYGAMVNASFFMHFPLRPEYRQNWVTREDLTRRGYLDDQGRVKFDGREFLIFYVGDYDCAAWLYQRMMDIWDDPARGQIPMMWCISPVLDRRAPMAMDTMRQTATPNDYFAAADNGAGYCEPGMLQEPRGISGLPSGLDAWARHCKTFYDRWGLSITGFIIYGHGPALNEAGLDCYASFSPNGIVPSHGPAALLHKQMPVLRFDHDVNEGDPAEAARHVVDRIARRRAEGYPPFHWFRNILKTPSWYVKTYNQIREMNPRIELLDAPTFFELYRIHLQTQSPAGLAHERMMSSVYP